MKLPPRVPGIVLTALLFAFLPRLEAEPVELKGSNGRVIAFDGIREAVPQGLWLRVQAGGEEIAVPWERFDLEALRSDHPGIHSAWEAASRGESTLLELGSYERAVLPLDIAAVLESVSPHEDAGPQRAADDLGIRPFLFHDGGPDHPLPFRLYAPELEIREGDERLPLVVWLHGAGSGGDDNVRNVNVNLARRLLDEDSPAGRCLILFPQFRDEYNWWTYVNRAGEPKRGVSGRQILDLVDEMVAKMPVDGDRVYLMGMSQGGFGIPYLVTAYPNRFAAQVLVSGMSASVPWSRKNVIPSWLYYSHDDLVMHQNDRDYGAEMTKALRDVADAETIKVTTYETEGHNGPLQRALEDPELLPWLFSQRNPETPQRDRALVSQHFD